MQGLTLKGKPTPSYIFDRNKFIDNYKSITVAFKSIYSNFKIGYSYKTNNYISICKLSSKIGSYAEVVSPYEYLLAKGYGVPIRNIIYNGVICDTENKFECASNGGKVNLDNLYELQALNEYAHQMGVILKVGIRVFFKICTKDNSKFGFDIEGAEFRRVLEGFSNLKVVGLHCHISGHRDLDSWHIRISEMIRLSRNFDIEYIDLGGNMFGCLEPELRAQFSHVPTYHDYADTVCTEMKKSFPGEEVELITENGTSLVGDCVYILSRITGVKVSCGRKKFICDTSFYDCGFLPRGKVLPYEILCNDMSYYEEDCDIVGYCCTEEDFLVRGYTGKIGVGDYLLLKNLGAYSYSIAPDFIKPKHEYFDI